MEFLYHTQTILYVRVRMILVHSFVVLPLCIRLRGIYSLASSQSHSDYRKKNKFLLKNERQECCSENLQLSGRH